MIGQVVAITGLTLREAVRRRTFLLVIVFAALLTCSSALFETIRPIDQLKLIQFWSILSTTVFATVMALVVAGTSLPAEFARRTIHNLSSKPISKAAILLGRFTGFSAALAIYLALACALSVLYIRILTTVNSRIPPPRTEPYVAAASFDMSAENAVDMGHDAETGRRTVGNTGRLTWAFPPLSAGAFDDPVPVKVSLGIYSESEQTESGPVRIRVVRSDGEILWPAAPQEGTAFLGRNIAQRVMVPREALTGTLPVRLEIAPVDRRYVIYGVSNSLELVGRETSFEWTMVKGFALILLESVILMSVSLAASVWLSSPVAMLVGFAVAVGGFGHGFIEEGVQISKKTIEAEAKKPGHGHRGHGSVPTPLLELSVAVTQVSLRIVPPFSRIDPTDLITAGREVGLREVMGRWINYSVYWAVPLAIGLLLMTLKEFN